MNYNEKSNNNLLSAVSSSSDPDLGKFFFKTPLPQDVQSYHKFLSNYRRAQLDRNIEPDSNETPQIKYLIQNLLHKGLKKASVEKQIVNFFRVYDEVKSERFKQLCTKLDRIKVQNTKLKNE